MIPYCFSCFFAYDPDEQLICFKSSPAAHHSSLVNDGTLVAGTINPDKLNRLAIKGIQFRGMVLDNDEVLKNRVRSLYHSRFPFSIAMPGEMYVIKLLSIKMTDNTLSFGKKMHWAKDAEPVG
jgi:uncharacterized protein YhbP (UPF0306 family)